MEINRRDFLKYGVGLVGTGLVGAGFAGCSGCVRKSEKDIAVDELSEVLGDRVRDKKVLYDLSLEDLVNYKNIYKNPKAFRDKEKYREWFRHYEESNLKDARGKLEGYADRVELGWDFKFSDADITALIYHGIKEGDVELESEL